ncbi:hypothetical protein [Paenirhodobacter populi]|uniref:hypothetical protein n=1 Tax=Paenirhodobacter populi TaxID=2306993 RepID=UPI000FE39DF5|nr:hypothetical protein [Sinirhodobacter populi]RWR06004.1 hypothetical protein D2T32_14945 [Sinirhodobacter populi]
MANRIILTDVDMSTDNVRLVRRTSLPQLISGLPEGEYSVYDTGVPVTAVVGGGTTGLVDTFTDVAGTLLTAHTSDSGHTWPDMTSGGPSAVIHSDGVSLVSGATTNGVTHLSNYASAADCYVEADVIITTENSGYNPWSILRAQDLVNWYAIGITGTRYLTVSKTVGGTSTVLYTSEDAIPVGTATVRLEAQGSTLRAYLNGVLATTLTDTDIAAAGKIGVRRAGGNTTNRRWDAIRAGDL